MTETQPHATRIGNVAIYVADLERAERFYVDVLGFAVRARVHAPTVEEVIVGAADGSGSALMLARPVESEPPGEPQGIWKVFVETDDAHGLFARTVAAGAGVVLKPTFMEQFRVTIAMVTDPDGYVVEIGQLAT